MRNPPYPVRFALRTLQSPAQNWGDRAKLAKIGLDKVEKIANLRRGQSSPSRFSARKGDCPMTRLVLAIVAAMALSGCQHSGQQVIDPFWGRTTVPPPATGSIGAPIGSPGCPQPVAQPIITPGTPVPGGCGPQATTPPNLLPATVTPMPSPAGTVAPMPATPGSSGNGVPYGNGASAVTAPAAGNATPLVAPPSGYSNRGLSPSGSPGSPPAATYPALPASPMAPSSTAPPTGGMAPTGPSPSPSAPAGPTLTPAPASTPPASGAPGYSPPDGSFNYHGSTQRPSGQGNWVIMSV